MRKLYVYTYIPSRPSTEYSSWTKLTAEPCFVSLRALQTRLDCGRVYHVYPLAIKRGNGQNHQTLLYIDDLPTVKIVIFCSHLDRWLNKSILGHECATSNWHGQYPACYVRCCLLQGICSGNPAISEHIGWFLSGEFSTVPRLKQRRRKICLPVVSRIFLQDQGFVSSILLILACFRWYTLRRVWVFIVASGRILHKILLAAREVHRHGFVHREAWRAWQVEQMALIPE